MASSPRVLNYGTSHTVHTCNLNKRGDTHFPGVLCIADRHSPHPTLLVDSDGLREFESRVEFVRCLSEPPTAHGNPEDDHLRGERLTEKGNTG